MGEGCACYEGWSSLAPRDSGIAPGGELINLRSEGLPRSVIPIRIGGSVSEA